MSCPMSKNSQNFEQNALDSVSWTSKNSFVAMEVDSQIKMEFWLPRFQKTDQEGFTKFRNLQIFIVQNFSKKRQFIDISLIIKFCWYGDRAGNGGTTKIGSVPLSSSKRMDCW